MEDIEEGMMVVLGLLLSEKSGEKKRRVSRPISWSSD